MKKALIFDAGPLINLGMNGLLYVIKSLRSTFPGNFIITPQVKYEVIDRPIKVQRFELEALRIQALLKDKIIDLPSSLGIDQNKINLKTASLVKEINSYIKFNGKSINIVSEGEISCLALSSILTEKGIENIIAIDERTTRILAENPKNLTKIISKKTHKPVTLTNSDFNQFKQFRFIRSSELIYIAHKKGLLEIKDPRALEAALYATKFKGSSISFNEIDIIKKM
jgi:hypothetical protein